MSDENLPRALMNNPWFQWNGKKYPVIFSANVFILACPICGDGIPCHGEPMDEMWLPHAVSVTEDGAITVTPSVVCPRNCGWHVTITNGHAA